MTHYTVEPIPDSKRWAVLADGHRVSRHNAKTNAVQRARELMDRTDSGAVKNRDGRYHRRL